MYSTCVAFISIRFGANTKRRMFSIYNPTMRTIRLSFFPRPVARKSRQCLATYVELCPQLFQTSFLSLGELSTAFEPTYVGGYFNTTDGLAAGEFASLSKQVIGQVHATNSGSRSPPLLHRDSGLKMLFW